MQQKKDYLKIKLLWTNFLITKLKSNETRKKVLAISNKGVYLWSIRSSYRLQKWGKVRNPMKRLQRT